MSQSRGMADITEVQRELLSCYEVLVRVLSEHRGELAPFEERNTAKAVAALWQIVNGLDLTPGHLYDIGV